MEIPAPETTFDPVLVQDVYSTQVVNVLFEGIVSYDYLARPLRFVPTLAETLPTVSADGLVWTIHLRHGIYFKDDPVFQGRHRELTSDDVLYSLKRFIDPQNHSPYAFLIEGKILGLDALAEAAKSSHRPFSYDTPVSGLEKLDAWTLRIHLNQPDPNFLHVLAQPNYGIVAREAVEHWERCRFPSRRNRSLLFGRVRARQQNGAVDQSPIP